METRIQYYNITDRQQILDANKSLYLIREENISDGNFLVFTDVAPVSQVPTLDELKASKISQLQTAYNDTLNAGFYSDPKKTGTPILFGYEDTVINPDRTRLKGILLSIANGYIVDPQTISYKGKGDVPQDNYTVSEFKDIIGKDAFNFERSNTLKYQQLEAQTHVAASSTELNAIIW